MLYVFLVDTGTMVTFDMNLAMESVTRLRAEIKRACHIPEDKQVLLISGGENLDPNARVCSYSAGTDTNPIFLFSKSTIESASPPSPSVYYGSDRDLKVAVDGSLNMPSSYDTVVARAQLALQFHDIAKEDLRSCERLVHDQHLQHQGWAAVIANLEDITSAFRTGTEQFKQKYEEYFKSRETYREMLCNFNDAVVLLGKTPLLPCLLNNVSPKQSTTMSASQPPLTLLEWISLQDSRGSLQQMAEQAAKEVEQFDKRVCDALMTEVSQVLVDVANTSMKEVKGLEDRLYSLEQLMFGARKIVQEQADMAQGFVQNQNRAGNLRDPSILPDLCASHRTQMILMLTKHQQLRDIQKKCSKAKEELSINLHTRLRWVMYVEKSICDCSDKLNIHKDNMKRLKRKLEILQQMYNAPKLYAMAVVEVLRRKQFQEQYTQWAEKLAGEAGAVHRKEVQRRKEFLDHIGRHFLLGLFSGLNEMPPPYATEAPDQCDQRLPAVTEADMALLQEKTPELADLLRYTPDRINVSEALGPKKCLTFGNDQRKDDNAGNTQTSMEEIHLMDETLQQELDDGQDGSIEVLSLEGSTRSPDEEHLDSQKFYSVAEQQQYQRQQSVPEREYTFRGRERADSLVELDEFTTADFYIDESLPSSYSDSQKQMLEKIGELQRQVQEKSAMLERSEGEVVGIRQGLESMHERFKNLGEIVERDALKLKCDVLGIEKQFQKERDDMTVTMATVTEKVLRVIRNVTERHLGEFESEKCELITEHQRVVSEMNDGLSLAQAKINDAQNEVQIYHEQLKIANEKCDALKEKMEGKLSSLKESLSTEHNDTITKLTLEQELELDKVKTDFDRDIEIRDQEIGDLKVQLDKVSHALEESLAKYETEFLQLSDKHKEDLETLERSVRAELENQFSEKFKKLESEHSEEVKTLQQKCLDDCLAKEKELGEKHSSEIEALQEKLVLASDQAMAELRATLENEKKSEIDELTKQMQEELVEKLENSKPIVESYGMQTSTICVENEESQTVAADSTPGETQTSVVVVNDGESQTVAIVDTQTGVTQTSAISQTVGESQTPVVLASEGHTQTALVETISSSIQTSLLGMNTAEVSDATVAAASATSQTQTSLETQSTSTQARIIDSGHEEGSSLEMISGEFHVDLNEMIDLEKHGHIIAEINKVHEEGKQKALQELRDELSRQHEEAVSSLVSRMQKEKQDSLTSLRSNITAEQQVAFNAAVDKIVMSKNKIIDEFKRKESSMLLSQEGISGQEALTRSQENELEQRTKRLETERQLEEALTKVSRLEEENLALSFAPASLSTDDKVQELQQVLKVKDDELKRVKMMGLSMTTSMRSAAQQDKVSIMTCNVGDTVLLCLDERHDQYVVFTVGTTLHFLHSDCLDALGLKTTPGESRKSWVLAEIVDKEYCQAKKSNNRFRVQVGTKFYRVKAKPWDKERLKSSIATASAGPTS